MDIQTKVINTLRVLSADQVQKAKSGHPGAPMGMSPMAYALWIETMKHAPSDPAWADRDRFVLSSGHASALLYSLLTLTGYGLTMDDLRQFRQWGSRTPGHPEYGRTPGVETTTGPLGQGIANAVGMAIAETVLAAHFNRPSFPIVDHRTYAFCGDGCMQEGIASEAASLAGTLQLNKLTLLYDDNEISIEGDTDIAFREDVGKRFEAYGWHVIRLGDGNDWRQVKDALDQAEKSSAPTLIICPTKIGFGCPAKEGTASAHGEPLGDDNLAAAKKNLGMPEDCFRADEDVLDFIRGKMARGEQQRLAWQKLFEAYRGAYPELAAEWDEWHSAVPKNLPALSELSHFEGKAATRNTSGEIIQQLCARIPNLLGGSADLAPSNKTNIKGGGDYSAENRCGRNFHFGIREHAMAAICNGIVLHGGLRIFCGTFFVFSDYMKHAMRLSALMKLPVIYVLTHDSIGVGEDGATHEPIEQLAALRSVPGFRVFRPADGKETAAAWLFALKNEGPTALVLSRQNLPTYQDSGEGAFRGGYILRDSDKETPDVILMASGSEVEQAMEARETLKAEGIDARVVSMPCMEMFDAQDQAWREKVLPSAVRARVSMEAASTMPWYRYVGLDGIAIGLDRYGDSAPANVLFRELGITSDRMALAAKQLLKK